MLLPLHEVVLYVHPCQVWCCLPVLDIEREVAASVDVAQVAHLPHFQPSHISVDHCELLQHAAIHTAARVNPPSLSVLEDKAPDGGREVESPHDVGSAEGHVDGWREGVHAVVDEVNGDALISKVFSVVWSPVKSAVAIEICDDVQPLGEDSLAGAVLSRLLFVGEDKLLKTAASLDGTSQEITLLRKDSLDPNSVQLRKVCQGILHRRF